MSGALEGNLLHFGRVLRAAGLPVGTGQILDAVGVETRWASRRERGSTGRSPPAS